MPSDEEPYCSALTPHPCEHCFPSARAADLPSYRLAALDLDFILGDSMRGVRFLLEYEKVEEALRDWGVMSTIVVFGSARVQDGQSGKGGLWYEEARKFGRLASERGGALSRGGGKRINVVATGGGPGIMEAANRGAHDVCAPSIGFNITLPREQVPNPYTTPELTFRFHYFAIRKMHLAMRASALVVFPGGFGTMDEMFEILTLRQTGKAPKVPIMLFDRSYWQRAIDLDVFCESGMIDSADRELFSYADTSEEVWQGLLAQGLDPGGND